VLEELNRRAGRRVHAPDHRELLRQPDPTCRSRSSSGEGYHAHDRQPGLQRRRRAVPRRR
jgi:hypothetical protein